MAAKQGVKVEHGTPITTVATNVYAVPSTLNRAVITSARVVNYSSAARVLNFWVVPTTGTAVDQYVAYKNKQIPKESTVNLIEIIEEPLNLGDQIWVQADANTALTLTLGLTTFPATS